MSRIIKSKGDIGLMSVFDLTVIMHKTRQVIMSVFVIQKKNHKMRQVIMSVFVMQKKNHKMRHKHILFIILQTKSFQDNLHILTYLEKHWFKIFQGKRAKVGGVRKKIVFYFS